MPSLTASLAGGCATGAVADGIGGGWVRDRCRRRWHRSRGLWAHVCVGGRRLGAGGKPNSGPAITTADSIQHPPRRQAAEDAAQVRAPAGIALTAPWMPSGFRRAGHPSVTTETYAIYVESNQDSETRSVRQPTLNWDSCSGIKALPHPAHPPSQTGLCTEICHQKH